MLGVRLSKKTLFWKNVSQRGWGGGLRLDLASADPAGFENPASFLGPDL